MGKIHLPKELKLKIQGLAVIIVAMIIIVQFLNFMAKIQKQNKKQEPEEEIATTSYREKNLDIYQQKFVPNEYQETFEDTIKTFLDSCVNHFPDDAYAMLSDDVKKRFYPAEEIFLSQYYNDKFQGNMEYTYEMWKMEGSSFTYKVKVFSDLLSSGKGDIAKSFKEDYITIVEDENTATLKFNINGFINTEKLNKKGENDKLSIEVSSVDRYVDYEIYTFKVTNKTDERILLDTLTKIDSIYLENEKGYKFEALKYENDQEDMVLDPRETETIQLKFNDAYKTDVYKIIFSAIIDEKTYQVRPYQTKDTLKIEMK